MVSPDPSFILHLYFPLCCYCSYVMICIILQQFIVYEWWHPIDTKPIPIDLLEDKLMQYRRNRWRYKRVPVLLRHLWLSDFLNCICFHEWIKHLLAFNRQMKYFFDHIIGVCISTLYALVTSILLMFISLISYMLYHKSSWYWFCCYQIYSEQDTSKMPSELGSALSIERETCDDTVIRIQALESIYLITLQVNSVATLCFLTSCYRLSSCQKRAFQCAN